MQDIELRIPVELTASRIERRASISAEAANQLAIELHGVVADYRQLFALRPPCDHYAPSSILSRRCSGQSGGLSREDWPTSTGRRSSAKSFVVGALDGSRGPRKTRCMLTRGTSGGRSQGAAHL